MFGAALGPPPAAQTSPALGPSLHAARDSGRSGSGAQSMGGNTGAPSHPQASQPLRNVLARSWSPRMELQQGQAWAKRAKTQGATAGMGKADPSGAPRHSPRTPHPSRGQGRTGVAAAARLSPGERPPLPFTQDRQDLQLDFFPALQL